VADGLWFRAAELAGTKDFLEVRGVFAEKTCWKE